MIPAIMELRMESQTWTQNWNFLLNTEYLGINRHLTEISGTFGDSETCPFPKNTIKVSAKTACGPKPMWKNTATGEIQKFQ